MTVPTVNTQRAETCRRGKALGILSEKVSIRKCS
jgi:hypothetical protein